MENAHKLSKISEALNSFDTSIEGLSYNPKNGMERTPEQKDEFLRDRFERKLKVIIFTLQSKQKFLEQLLRGRKRRELLSEDEKAIVDREYLEIIKLTKKADQIKADYALVKNEKLRKQNIPTETKIVKYKRPSPYKILKIDEKELDCYTEKEKDAIIERIKDILLTQYQCELNSLNKKNLNKRYTQQARIEIKIQNIKEAYEKLKTSEKRRIYKIKQEQENRQEIEIERIKELRTLYSHASEYDPTLISTTTKFIQDNPDSGVMHKKSIEIKEEYDDEHFCPDPENRNLSFKKIAEVSCDTTMCGTKSYMYEYEVKRIIDGEEKIVRVYTADEIRIIELSIDRKTNRPCNPNYYNAVINGLFSEDMLENSDVNSGFLGSVKQDKEGNYHLTIEKDKLSMQEKTMLTVAMMLKEQLKNKEQETR